MKTKLNAVNKWNEHHWCTTSSNNEFSYFTFLSNCSLNLVSRTSFHAMCGLHVTGQFRVQVCHTLKESCLLALTAWCTFPTSHVSFKDSDGEDHPSSQPSSLLMALASLLNQRISRKYIFEFIYITDQYQLKPFSLGSLPSSTWKPRSEKAGEEHWWTGSLSPGWGTCA